MRIWTQAEHSRELARRRPGLWALTHGPGQQGLRLGGWKMDGCSPSSQERQDGDMKGNGEGLWRLEETTQNSHVSNSRVVVQSLSRVQLFVTPWTVAHQASLPFTIFRSLLKLCFIESVMPSNHLILCRPLLLLASIFPSMRVFSNE